jgi:hypothetical protein
MNEEDIVVEDNGEDIGISEETYTQETSETVEIVSQDDLNLSESAGIGMMSVGVACMLSLGISQVLKMFRRA